MEKVQRPRHCVLFLLFTALLGSWLSGCDPVLSEREQNGLKMEPFAPREYIRLRRSEGEPEVEQRDWEEELDMWTDQFSDIQQTALIQYDKQLYIGIVSQTGLEKETQQQIETLLSDWLSSPLIEQVFVTYDPYEATTIAENEILSDSNMTDFNWIPLRQK